MTDTVTGCSSSATSILIVDTSAATCTSIEEIGSSMATSIYPNPTSGLLNISVKNSNSNQLQVRIFDITGTVVYSSADRISNAGYAKQINLEGLAKGIYTIQLTAGTDMITQKLILQ
jgi:hypothetical protein